MTGTYDDHAAPAAGGSTLMQPALVVLDHTKDTRFGTDEDGC